MRALLSPSQSCAAGPHRSKALVIVFPAQAGKWLEASEAVFGAILDAEDSPGRSAAALQKIWQESFVATGESAMVQHLVSVLMPKQVRCYCWCCYWWERRVPQQSGSCTVQQ